MRFRLIETAPAAGAWNMALDQALMTSVRSDGVPVLRFYRWAPACLSLGRNQPARGFYEPRASEARGIDVVRRPTGGRAVLHDRELTYSVVMESRMLGGPRECYLAANRALRRGLRQLGVDAELQPAGERQAPPLSLDPCFRDPAEGELVVHGRKLVGSAQVRERGILLQHGSLLVEGSQSDVLSLLRPEAAATLPMGEESAVLSDFLRPLPSWESLVQAIANGWQLELACELVPSAATAEELERAALLATRFSDPAWTWRC